MKIELLILPKKYADKIVFVKRKGVSAGRNEGSKVAKGNILIFLDADKIVSYNTIEEIVKAFNKKKVVGATCTILPLSGKNEDIFIYWFLNQFVEASIKIGRPKIPGMCCAYRKEVFYKVGGFDEKIRFLEDFDLSDKISKFGKIIFIKNTVVLTSVRRLERWGRVKAIKKYLSFWLKQSLTKKPISPLNYKR
ncbi:MAG: glycosyltransferase [Candidatus Aenigmatarchaeota archaeon]